MSAKLSKPPKKWFLPDGKERKYCLHRATGQAYVKIRGKRRYLGAYGSADSYQRLDRIVADEWAKWRKDGSADGAAHPTPPQPGAELVVDVIEAYWEHAKVWYRDKHGQATGTLQNLRYALRTLKTLYSRLPAAAFDDRCLVTVQDQLIANGLARVTINQRVEIVRRMFKWAGKQRLVPSRVYHDLKLVDGLVAGRSKAKETAPIGPVSDRVIRVTLRHLPPIVADMVRFQRITACRPGEVCMLRPCDVTRTTTSDEVRPLLASIDEAPEVRELDCWEYRPQKHKTEHHGRPRVVYIGPRAKEVLLPYLARPHDAYCFSPADSMRKLRLAQREKRKTKVQPSQKNRRVADPKRMPGNRYTKDAYNLAIRRACEIAFNMPEHLRKIDKSLPEEDQATLNEAAKAWRDQYVWTPNQLRHTAATEIRREFGLEGVAGCPGAFAGQRDADLRGARSGQGGFDYAKDWLNFSTLLS